MILILPDAIGTVSITCTPSYASIGLIAPLLVVTGRLVQGLSAGVEAGVASVYLFEVATPGHKGFYVSWQAASQQVAVELWLSFLFASYNGALIVFLTEIMPADVRTARFSLVHSSATAIFGGFTPAISTYLIHATGDRAIPGLWLSFAAVCGLIAAMLLSSSRVAQFSVMHGRAA